MARAATMMASEAVKMPTWLVAAAPAYGVMPVVLP